MKRHQGQPCIEDDSGLCLGQVSLPLHVLAGYVSNAKFKSPCFRSLASAATKHRVGIEPEHSRWRSENTSRQRHLASPLNTFRALLIGFPIRAQRTSYQRPVSMGQGRFSLSPRKTYTRDAWPPQCRQRSLDGCPVSFIDLNLGRGIQIKAVATMCRSIIGTFSQSSAL